MTSSLEMTSPLNVDNVTIEKKDAAVGVITSVNLTLVKTKDDFPSEREWSHIEVEAEHDDTMVCRDHHTVKSIDYIKAETGVENDAGIGVDDFSFVKTEDDFPSGEWSHIEVKVEHDVSMECSDRHAVELKNYNEAETDDLTVKKKTCDGDEVACLSGKILDRLKKAKSGGDASKDFNVPEHIGASSPVSRRDLITGQKTYSCFVCTYESKSKSNLIIHTRRHTGEKPFSCVSCDHSCSSAAHLSRHMKSRHAAEKPFSCNYCVYRFSFVSSLMRHMRSHTGEKPYSCNSCEYRCSRAGCLKIHKRTHTGERPFLCNSCPFRCSHASSLKDHLRTHTGEKPFSCDFCDYQSRRAGDLRRHVRTHTGEKPFSCTSCDYRCSQAFSLKEHNMRIHTGEKPYLCSVCEYRCSVAGGLRIHMRTHTGEKPFSCDSCEYNCCTAGSFRKHMRVHSSS